MALVRCMTEMGMGVDVHGLDDTLEATRAVFDAIHHSRLGFARLVGATADEMIVHVLIGVPRPEQVQVDAVVYTTCEAACPIIVSLMQRLKAALPSELRPHVGFVLVTFDPARDTVLSQILGSVPITGDGIGRHKNA